MGGLESTQREGVGDHEHRGEAHRNARQPRVEETDRGDRDQHDVIGERPEQVALDGAQRAT